MTTVKSARKNNVALGFKPLVRNPRMKAFPGSIVGCAVENDSIGPLARDFLMELIPR